MKIKSFILAASAIGLTNISGGVYAMPVTIDFESLMITNSRINSQGSSYSEDGFTLNGQALATLGTLDARFTGSTALFFNHNITIPSAIQLTQTDNNPFALTSIDLAELGINPNAVATIEFTGNIFGGGIANQSFTLDNVFGAETFNFSPVFSNLTSVSWLWTSPIHQFDNIRVNGSMSVAVPEPPTSLLLVCGLAGLIGWQYRRFCRIKF